MARRSIPCVVAAMLTLGTIGGAGAFMVSNPSSALHCLHSLRSCLAKASPTNAVAKGMKLRQPRRSYHQLVLSPKALSGQRKMSQGGGYAWSSSLWLTAVEIGSGGGSGGGITRRSGGGGGGGGDDGNEGEESSIAALLKQYGLVASQLPKGAEALDPKILKRFLDSYSNGLNRWLIDLWPAWRDKMLADPEFAYKMFVEETVGLGLAMSGTVAARGADLLKELDFFRMCLSAHPVTRAPALR